MIEYKYKKRENKFTENGHTMFEGDVLQRLKRLAYLEEQFKESKENELKAIIHAHKYALSGTSLEKTIELWKEK